ncbi:MAG: DinB family protein [Terriglobales bacterium]
MKTIGAVLVTILALCSFGLAQTNEEKKTISQVLDGGIKTIESEFVPAAEAMPEGKYDFAPTNGEFKGVRTFAEQIKHVAASNYLIAAHILGEKPPVDANGGKGPDSVKSKADILKYLKDSFAYAHKAVATITDANALEPIPSSESKSKTTRLSLAMIFSWHGFDHYGQMVEYLRMNGIVPPASRG